MVNSNDNRWDDAVANYGNKLVLSENGLVATNAQDLPLTDFLFYECNNVRAKTPFTLIPAGADDRRTFYFELLIKNMTGRISIGVSVPTWMEQPATPEGIWFGEFNLPFADDSYWRVNSNQQGEGFVVGDVIGCALVQFPWDIQRQLFFTKNGQAFGPTFILPREQNVLYPTVSLFGPGTSVEANFGDDQVRKPFRYNIAEH